MSATTEAPVKTRKEQTGVVISDKLDKTIVVQVVRRVPHTQFRKIVKVSRKFHAHDAEGKAKVGDQVRIVETRPMSRLKRWELVEVIKH